MPKLTPKQVLARHDWLTGTMRLRYVLAEKAYFDGDARIVQAETMLGLINEDRFRAAVQNAVGAIRDAATMTVIP